MKILQVGCHKCDDTLSKYILSKGAKKVEHLILIDIDASFVDIANTLYKDVGKLTTIVTAITPDPNQSEIILYQLKSCMFSEHTSFNYDHMIAHHHSPEKIETVNHPARTITSVLEEYNIEELDEFHIDTEGLDVDILYSINYDKYLIKKITFEHVHCGGPFAANRTPKLNNFLQYMKEKGYRHQLSTSEFCLDLIKESNNG